MKVFFDLVGCRVNQAEIESMAAQVRALGHETTGRAEEADWAVLNTCTVTREAERDSRQKARWIHGRNPAAKILITGCWSTLEPVRAAALPGVSQVVPNREKELLAGRFFGAADAYPDGKLRMPLQGARHRTRAFIKAQDGCDNACAYCITRLARGPVRSRPADETAGEIRAAEESGAQEAVLAGVHLGAWGKDLGLDFGLERLLETVLARTRIPRIRLSSLEPWDLRPEFFRFWEDPRLCPHLHLPLQSGCAATLRRMARRTTPEDFRRLAAAARAAIPDLAITSDLIVGFPGEGEADFIESLEFAKEMNFARLHVFRYSARPGTAAARLDGAVPPAEIRGRAQAAQRMASAAAESFARGFLGRELDVLWDERTHCGVWHGLTGNYLSVRAASEIPLGNRITRVRIAAVGIDGVEVEPLSGG